MTETSMASAPPAWSHDLERWLSVHTEELVGIRRQLHAHPELGREEYATTELVAERLRVAGLAPRVLSSGTGLICDIEPDGPWSGNRIALRADIDALPMQDEKDVPYRSQVPGVAHACGHDVHTTVVLGAALFLARHRSLLDGPVRLLFQPAEEQIPGGALDLVDEGGLVDVAAVVGLHCEPRLDAGQVGLRQGAITSAADSFEIRLHGPGGHTARPQETVDLVPVAAEVVRRVPTLVRERLADVGPVLLVFGALHAGDAGNVIPTLAVLRGSIRTRSTEVWERVGPALEAAVAEVAGHHGAGHETTYRAGVPPVVNDAAVIERVRTAARRVLGDAAVVEAAQSWGGDDFSHLLREAPGAYLRLGVHGPDDTGPRLDLHAGHFDVDERAIPVGVRLLVATTLQGGGPG